MSGRRSRVQGWCNKGAGVSDRLADVNVRILKEPRISQTFIMAALPVCDERIDATYSHWFPKHSPRMLSVILEEKSLHGKAISLTQFNHIQKEY